MIRPYQLFVGLRYTRAKRRNHFISFISALSMLGIAVGVTALITVISVMNGFETELRERILGMVSHATIADARGQLTDWPLAMELASEHPRVVGAAPYIERETLLKGRAVSGALLRGIAPRLEGSVSRVPENMIAGTIDDLVPGDFGIVLGTELAYALGADVGDTITVFAPELRATAVGVMPQLKRFTVVGLFQAGMHEYDRGLALVNIEDAGKLLRLGDRVTGVRLELDDMFQAWFVARELAQQLPGLFRVSDWSREHSSFFRAVQTEKTVMFVILSLIVAVAAFNIISTLVMVVTDKQADIAVLRTLGATPRSIMAIFIVNGAIIGVIGTALGIVGGVALASNVETIVPAIERMFNTDLLAADVYYISDLPSEMKTADVLKITALSLVLSLVATIYPAWRASRTDPATALRYE